MPVNLSPPDPKAIFPVAGIRIGVTEAGIRKTGRKDLTVFLLDEGASVAGVFTRNRFCAAPVQVCRDHLAQGAAIRAMVINTGNANAGPGTTLGGAVAQSLILANWRNMGSKADFQSHQQSAPLLAAMGMDDQRATVI